MAPVAARERAEAAGEADQIGVGQVLVADQHNRVIEQGPVDRGKRRRIQPAHIHPARFGAKYSIESNHPGDANMDVRRLGGRWNGTCGLAHTLLPIRQTLA